MGLLTDKYDLSQLDVFPLVYTISCPLSTNRFTILTASISKPPRLPFKSKIIFLQFLFFKSSKASLTSLLQFSVKAVNLI